MRGMKLANRRHEIFATELATGAPLLSAYLAAGYKESYSARFNASRLRNTTAIKARIDELQAGFAQSSFVRLEWVQAQLLAIIEGKADSCVRVDGKGKCSIEFDRMAALTALAKTIGGLTMKNEVSGPGGKPIESEDKTPRSDIDIARRMAWLLGQAVHPDGG